MWQRWHCTNPFAPFRQVVLWHKPFCADLSAATFASILHFLETQGAEFMASPAAPVEDEAVLLGFLSLLADHFVLAAEAGRGGGEGDEEGAVAGFNVVGAREKASLERVLYRCCHPSLLY